MSRRYTVTFAFEVVVEFDAEDDTAAQIIAESCDPINEGDLSSGPDIVDIESRGIPDLVEEGRAS